MNHLYRKVHISVQRTAPNGNKQSATQFQLFYLLYMLTYVLCTMQDTFDVLISVYYDLGHVCGPAPNLHHFSENPQWQFTHVYIHINN